MEKVSLGQVKYQNEELLLSFSLQACPSQRWVLNLEGIEVKILEVEIAEVRASSTRVMGWGNNKFRKGVDVNVPSDSRKCDNWRIAMDRTSVGRVEKAMVEALNECVIDGGGVATGQNYYEANSSFSTKYDVQYACTISGGGDGGVSAQCNVDSKGRIVTGYAEAERMELEGGGEGDASC